MNGPLISVVMPAYNAENYILESIESVIDQTYENWELLILDDGSTDGTLALATKYSSDKISIFAESNKGQSTQLNKGISLARGEYIAIAHADDINHRQRLQLQFDFLEQYPEIGICGSAIEAFNTNQNFKKKITFPSNTDSCYSSLYYGNPLAHPSVMLRKSVLANSNLKYNVKLVAAEDYDLWIRLSKFTKISNLSNILVYYRLHNQQTSETKKKEEDETVIESRKMLVNQLCENADKDQISLVFNFFYNPKKLTAYQQWKALSLCNLFISRHCYMSPYNAQAFSIHVLEKNLRDIPFSGRLKHLRYLPLLIKDFGLNWFYFMTKSLFLKKS